MERVADIKRLYQLLALGQDEAVTLVLRQLVCGIAHVTCRGAQDEVAPESGLHEYALAQDGVGAGEDGA